MTSARTAPTGFESSFHDAVRRWLNTTRPKLDVQQVTSVVQDVEAGSYANPESGSWTEITVFIGFVDSVGARGQYAWNGDMVDLIRAL